MARVSFDPPTGRLPRGRLESALAEALGPGDILLCTVADRKRLHQGGRKPDRSATSILPGEPRRGPGFEAPTTRTRGAVGRGGQRSIPVTLMPEARLQELHAYHRRFRRWLIPFHGVASRYLSHYFQWHRTVTRLASREPEHRHARSLREAFRLELAVPRDPGFPHRLLIGCVGAAPHV